MKVLFLVSTFNGMVQRAWLELDRLNHQIKVQIAGDEDVMHEAVKEFHPDLIIAPFLTRKIPADIWQQYTCLIIHPGIPGDRGASSLDWAILRGESEWGVSILEAAEKMDTGTCWAAEYFPMRNTSKSCLYRHEVTQAAMRALLNAVTRFSHPDGAHDNRDSTRVSSGTWNRSTRQEDFHFQWSDCSEDIMRKMNAADSSPGVLVRLMGQEYYAYGAHQEGFLRGKPGELLAQRDSALCVATGDGALWLTHLKSNVTDAIKLPAVLALGDASKLVPISELSPLAAQSYTTYREIQYEEEGEIGYLRFDFYNGAMSTDQCNRLRHAINLIKQRTIRVLVLLGGSDVWSNGIHLNIIEHSDNPADASWANIHAIDDLILEIIQSPEHYVITAMQGNAGAGGVSLALSGDKVLARRGIILNPHTRNMGLYGSEYWTYLLPKKIGMEKARQFTEECLPWGTAIAKEIGLIDEVYSDTATEFVTEVRRVAQEVVSLPYFDKLLQAKRFQRSKDERIKPLATYREEELAHMWKNFYENDAQYDERRFCFVRKIPYTGNGEQITDRDWYSSRRKIYRRRKWESIIYESHDSKQSS